jgi:hypothetical protein
LSSYKNTAFLIFLLYQKSGYKSRKARHLPGLCLQSERNDIKVIPLF